MPNVPFFVTGQKEREAFGQCWLTILRALGCALGVPFGEGGYEEPWLRGHGGQGLEPGEQTHRDWRTLANEKQREANSSARNWGSGVWLIPGQLGSREAASSGESPQNEQSWAGRLHLFTCSVTR